MPKMPKNIPQPTKTVDVEEEAKEFLDQETGESVWLKDVPPRKLKRITKQQLYEELEKLKERLEEKESHSIMRAIHLFGEIFAIGGMLFSGVNPIEMVAIPVLAIHVIVVLQRMKKKGV